MHSTQLKNSTTELSGPERKARSRSLLPSLCLAAIGVVYGDIGTSPLYALRECFYGSHAIPVTRENIVGILSLVFWSLIIVVTLKYHVYILRADNNGEGGILALMALVRSHVDPKRKRMVVVALGLFGAALLYGDGMITPAISVLSAVEGLHIATPTLTAYVVPVTVAILVGLFLFQRRGTAVVGSVFGPVTLVWFLTIAVLGIGGILKEPSVLQAVNPLYAAQFFARNGSEGYFVLGAVFLVTTGGEALYADLGHFGEKPIQIDWFALVAPSLLLNYFGQGALLLSDPEAARNPFYLLAPTQILIPMVFLSTAATIIASQAVISGVFSLTRQASLLGYAPRVNVVHTSSHHMGQIYIPGANWLLMTATIYLVLTFKSSSNLAAAYGIAVTSTMMITTLLAYLVARKIWKWKRWSALAVTLAFFAVDLAFFGANIVKFIHGGWVPLVVGAALFMIFLTWEKGRKIQAAKLQHVMLPLELFLHDPKLKSAHRVPGTAIFMTGNSEGTPIALLHNIKHNRILHSTNVITTLVPVDAPYVSAANRVSAEDLGLGFYRVLIRYGFMEDPDVPKDLRSISPSLLPIDLEKATYFLSRNTLIRAGRPMMSRWRHRLFTFMNRNASLATEFFRLPPNRVVELGMQIEI